MDEQEAVARLQRGDISGLEPLVRRYQEPALHAAVLVCRDGALAEDLVQAAFVRAYERIGQFDARRPFGPWFIRSVVNDALKAVTRRRQVPLDPAWLDRERRRFTWPGEGAPVALDDLVDALACLITAYRIFRGEACHFPSGREEYDSHGLRMEIAG